jgi:uncharacterized membrane protein
MSASLQINQTMSLYIPYVSSEITKEQVAYVFESNLFGEVSRVDFISKTDYKDNYYNAVYIHFKEWKNSIMVHHFQEKLINYMNGDTENMVRVVYDDPYYWNVFINKSSLTKHVSGSGERKMCLDLSDFYETRKKEQEQQSEVVNKNKQITTNEMGAYILSILRNNSCEKCN